jgi:hypothetical protein
MTKIAQFVLQEGTEYIKIHGLQRTGTNYLALLVDDNLNQTKSLINVGGWKHGHYCAPWVLNQEVHVLTITKNPYAWLVSLYIYWRKNDIGPDLKDQSFNEFVRNKVEFERQGGIPFLYRTQNPVQFWNDMNFHWMSIRLNKKKSLVIPYEALLVDAHGVIKVVAEEFGLTVKPEFQDTKTQLAPGEETAKVGDKEFDRDYYLKEQFLQEYTLDLLDFVNNQLDPELMKALGYSFVNRTAQ